MLSVTWGELKDLVRLQINEEEDNGEKYTDLQMWYAMRWAIAEVSQHTAVATATGFTANGSAFAWDVPQNCMEDITLSGLVSFVQYENANPIYLEASNNIPGYTYPTRTYSYSTPQTYWHYPEGQLSLPFIPPLNSVVQLRYFAYWDMPGHANDDAFRFNYPFWMEKAVVFFMASSLLDKYATQSADIKRWDRKQASGNPEHNPLLKQGKHFQQAAREVLWLHTEQDRRNFFKRGFG